jgi:hypothetical protein
LSKPHKQFMKREEIDTLMWRCSSTLEDFDHPPWEFRLVKLIFNGLQFQLSTYTAPNHLCPIPSTNFLFDHSTQKYIKWIFFK